MHPYMMNRQSEALDDLLGALDRAVGIPGTESFFVVIGLSFFPETAEHDDDVTVQVLFDPRLAAANIKHRRDLTLQLRDHLGRVAAEMEEE